MKSHKTKDQCFDAYLKRTGKRPSHEVTEAFEAGWYACAIEINEGEDSDWLQERLYEEGFLQKDDDES